MNNNTIRIALSSVLIYLSFKKLYSILTTLLMWVNVELRIENEAVLISINTAIGILSVLLLIVFANRILSIEKLENRAIYLLIGLTTTLTLCMVLINKFYAEYLVNTELKDFDKTRLFQFGWSKGLGTVFTLLVLLYFVWKMKNKTVANKK